VNKYIQTLINPTLLFFSLYNDQKSDFRLVNNLESILDKLELLYFESHNENHLRVALIWFSFFDDSKILITHSKSVITLLISALVIMSLFKSKISFYLKTTKLF
jgi:hypothetical protein